MPTRGRTPRRSSGRPKNRLTRRGRHDQPSPTGILVVVERPLELPKRVTKALVAARFYLARAPSAENAQELLEQVLVSGLVLTVSDVSDGEDEGGFSLISHLCREPKIPVAIVHEGRLGLRERLVFDVANALLIHADDLRHAEWRWRLIEHFTTRAWIVPLSLLSLLPF